MPIQSLYLRNLLSFKEAQIDLYGLTVLIGANASGKSNLISAMGLLRGAAVDFQTAVEDAGGSSLIRKTSDGPPVASLRCKYATVHFELEYELSFRFEEETVVIEEERLCTGDGKNPLERQKDGAELQSGETMLSGCHKDTPASQFRRAMDRIRIYRGFDTGPGSRVRIGSKGPTSRGLKEDGSNLASMLDAQKITSRLDPFDRYIHLLSERFREIKVVTANGFNHLTLAEEGLDSDLPASRLSDGTLRFLCLLAALFDNHQPEWPVCIEEPEAGLHPDALRLVAEALLEASSRRQVIVTTHSEALIDALSSHPETVVVCDRAADGATQFRRLNRESLSEWLERYSLGELWRKGEIGGNRW